MTTNPSQLQNHYSPLFSQQRRNGPWGNLSTPYPAPSSFTVSRRLSFDTAIQTGDTCRDPGRGGGGGRNIQDLRMTSGRQDTNYASEHGCHGMGGTTINLSSSQSVTQEILDLSGTKIGRRQSVGEAVERQEDERRTPDPQTFGAPSPNGSFSGGIPVDLTQTRKDPICDDDIGDFGISSGAPKASVNDMKTELDDTKEKLERSQEAYNRLVFQYDKYTLEETTALMKAIAWKGQLLMKIDGLYVSNIRNLMKSQLYWDEDFRGHGSLLKKFRENLHGIRDRSGESLKNKWYRDFEAIALNPLGYFSKKVIMEEIDSKDVIFLALLGKEFYRMKGSYYQLTDTPPPSTNGSASVSSSSNWFGVPFLNKHPYETGRKEREMPVFSASNWNRFTSG